MFRRLLMSAAGLALAASAPALGADLDLSNGEAFVEDGAAYVEFDVSWDLSWRDETNWDAAWVVVKLPRGYVDYPIGVARDGHAVVDAGDRSRPGPVIDPSADGMGVFLYRDEVRAARGVNDWRVRLRLDLPDGLEIEELPERLGVHGVEMVYIPEGPFDVGDPQPIEAAPENAFFRVTEAGDGAAVYRVESAGAIAYCDGPGSLCDAETREEGRDPGPIPASYPNGYSAFYLMKYDVTQGQYADYLNTLAGFQTRERDPRAGISYSQTRETLTLVDGVYVAARPDRTMGHLNWGDAAGYADWAGLRPPSELELIKAARGPEPAVADEFAWGTTEIYSDDVIRDPDGDPAPRENGDEYIEANANFGGEEFEGGDGGEGPLRVDIFEARAVRTGAENVREAGGLGYYGVANLSGEMFERFVTASGAAGRGFTGAHGDGLTAYPARADVEGWPGLDGEGLGVAFGAGFAEPERNRLAFRRYGNYAAYYRGGWMSFRGARTAD